MRRLMVAGATLALLGAGLFIPAQANPASSPTDALTGGTVKLVVGTDPVYGFPNWTTTVSGQVAAGGRTYSGTASGRDVPAGGIGPSFAPLISFSGSSSTGSIDATCGGEYVTVPGTLVPGAPQPDGQNPAGLLPTSCWVSIDGAPKVNIEVVFALAPTADPTVFQGVYAGLPDATALQNLPLSFGTASAETTVGFNTVSFGYTGQLAFGGQVFHGTASGATGVPGIGNVMPIPTFTLAGSSSSGSLSAACSGLLVRINPVSDFVGAGFYPIGAALSVLTCSGSVNGGPAAQAVLVSAYGATAEDVGGRSNDYSGVFVGI